RTALIWIIEQDASDLGLRLVRALEGFWFHEGYQGEGRQWTMLLLARARAVWPAGARAEVLRIAGSMSWQHGEYAAATGYLQESIEIFRQLADKNGLTFALTQLGRAVQFQGEYAQAGLLLDEAVELARDIGDPGRLAVALMIRGFIPMQQADYSAARLLFAQALAIYESLESPWGIPQSLNNLGDVARCEGDYERAGDLYHESLTRFRANGIQVEVASVLHNLGYVMLAQGNQSRAQALFAESLALHREHDNQVGVLESLAGFGALLAAQGQLWRAAVLFGAITNLRAPMQAPMWPAERVEFERHLEAVRAALGDDALAQAFRQSQDMTLPAVMAHAFDLSETALQPPWE
ncbi:MAG: tetratricopeptide repeat protein, partial [Anaerolineales bacterium]